MTRAPILLTSVLVLCTLLFIACAPAPQSPTTAMTRDTSFAYDNTTLTPLQHQVLWESGTERAFANEYWNNEDAGLYVTRGCGIPVFTSRTKFDSGTGWPSFWQPLDPSAITLVTDTTLGFTRTEVKSSCGEHLGHVFDDGPKPTGLRYCMNSAALVFIPLANLTAQQRALYDKDYDKDGTVAN